VEEISMEGKVHLLIRYSDRLCLPILDQLLHLFPLLLSLLRPSTRRMNQEQVHISPITSNLLDTPLQPLGDFIGMSKLCSEEYIFSIN
jgi:hypothetical protein